MHTQFMYLFSVKEFKPVTITCAGNLKNGENVKIGGQRVTSGPQGKAECMQLCKDKDDCQFIFLNNKNWCNMYKSCDEHRRVPRRGATYTKRKKSKQTK